VLCCTGLFRDSQPQALDVRLGRCNGCVRCDRSSFAAVGQASGECVHSVCRSVCSHFECVASFVCELYSPAPARFFQLPNAFYRLFIRQFQFQMLVAFNKAIVQVYSREHGVAAAQKHPLAADDILPISLFVLVRCNLRRLVLLQVRFFIDGSPSPHDRCLLCSKCSLPCAIHN
jgi:hypothetical protein